MKQFTDRTIPYALLKEIVNNEGRCDRPFQEYINRHHMVTINSRTTAFGSIVETTLCVSCRLYKICTENAESESFMQWAKDTMMKHHSEKLMEELL